MGLCCVVPNGEIEGLSIRVPMYYMGVGKSLFLLPCDLGAKLHY